MKFRILMLLMSVSVITPAFLGSASARMVRQPDVEDAECSLNRNVAKSVPQDKKLEKKEVGGQESGTIAR